MTVSQAAPGRPGRCQTHRIRLHRQRQVDESGEHFLPGLIAPIDVLRRVGIERIVRRIVVPRHAFQHRPFGQHLRLLQIIRKLPVEVVARYAEQRFRLPVRVGCPVLESLAPHVHVRKHGEQRGIVMQRDLGKHCLVRRARRNVKVSVGDQAVHHTLLRRLLGELEAYPAAIRGRLAVRRVVHLEDQIAARRNQPRLPGLQVIGKAARHVDAGHFDRVRYFQQSVACIGLVRPGLALRHKRLAVLGLRQVLHSRRPHLEHDMVHHS